MKIILSLILCVLAVIAALVSVLVALDVAGVHLFKERYKIVEVTYKDGSVVYKLYNSPPYTICPIWVYEGTYYKYEEAVNAYNMNMNFIKRQTVARKRKIKL